MVIKENLKSRKYKEGETYGSLLILGRENGKIRVQCQVCKNDPELYGSAEYLIESDYFNTEKLPCGCSHTPRRSQKQWEVLLSRKAKDNNENFIGFVDGEYKNQNSKINLSCNDCGFNWESCSVSNYMRNRSCPMCANMRKAAKRSTNDTIWIDRFVKDGNFDLQVHSFKRCTNTGRLWEVSCKICGDEKKFISDRSNLVAGKVPCDCNRGGGFNKNIESYVYVVKIEGIKTGFTGFGITNFPHRRIKDHARESWKHIQGITDVEVYECNGTIALQIETKLKHTFPLYPQEIPGFIREATLLCEFENVKSFIVEQLNER